MFFHLLLTTDCDLECRYCYGKSCEDMDADFVDFNVDYEVPAKINYSIELLEKLMEKDPEPVLIFYGGEPMLCLYKMKQIMDNVSAKQFNIQTNGLHLNKIEPEYVNRLTTIFVSIDGTEQLTDYYRGKGIYKKVTQNIQRIKDSGFEGEIIIADNGQGRGRMNWSDSNAEDTSQTTQDVVDDFSSEGRNVAALLWDGMRSTPVSEYASGDFVD